MKFALSAQAEESLKELGATLLLATAFKVNQKWFEKTFQRLKIPQIDKSYIEKRIVWLAAMLEKHTYVIAPEDEAVSIKIGDIRFHLLDLFWQQELIKQ